MGVKHVNALLEPKLESNVGRRSKLISKGGDRKTAEQLTSTTILKQVLEAAFRKFFEAKGNSPPRMLLLGT